MVVAVITNEGLKEELLAQGTQGGIVTHWLTEPDKVSDASCYIDLLFDYSDTRIHQLKTLNAELVIVNAVTTTCSALPENFIRINGWAGFLGRPLVEAAAANELLKAKAESVFGYFKKTMEWVPDITGFISPRVISMLVNEAYFTIKDEVTGKQEIDIAMKLGTKYPMGPFEWSRKTGIKNIYGLLRKLAEEQERYTPCDLLQQEALQE